MQRKIMITKLILINILSLIISTSCFAQNLEIKNCNFWSKNDTIHIELNVYNVSNEVVYMPLQFWDVEVVTSGNSILSFPSEQYPSNRIYIYSNNYDALRTRGTKCCFPKYDTLPFLTKIIPKSSKKINLKILSNSKLLDTVQYKSEIFLVYFVEKIILKQYWKIKKSKSKFLVNDNKLSFLLEDGINDLKKYKTNFRCENKLLTDNYLETFMKCLILERN